MFYMRILKIKYSNAFYFDSGFEFYLHQFQEEERS
jgi:hypothetical protein